MAVSWDDSRLTHGYADLGDVRLHYVEAGSGPLVILLHGFPECWYTWRHQILPLAEAGFHVVAPDMRGYNLSGKPRGIRHYRIDKLAGDVAGLIDVLGSERASVVGHDWGAGVAWAFAMRRPEKLERLAIINGPHPERFLRGLRTVRQLCKSWYMFVFQLPWLPEAALRYRNFDALRRQWKFDPARPEAYSDEEIERLLEAAAQPGALTATINYYRALFRHRVGAFQRIDAPTLVIWGERDRYLGKELAEPDARWVPNARVVRLPSASHWVCADEPERVSSLLIDFLGPIRPRP